MPRFSFNDRFVILYQLLKDFAGPLATIVASVVAVVVAWRLGRSDISESQLRISREKLRFDLFEKRYAVYIAARDFILVINRDANLHDDTDMVKFDIGTADACFLFRNEVEEYLLDVRRRSITLHVLRKEHRTRQQHHQLPIENYQNHLMALLKSFTDDILK